MILLFAYSELRSTSKVRRIRIQQTFIKRFTYMLCLLVLYLHRHIENPGIVTTVYSSIFTHIQGTFRNISHAQVYWETISLTGFWIRPSLKKNSLTCRVTSHYVLYMTCSEPWYIQNPVYHREFRHI